MRGLDTRSGIGFTLKRITANEPVRSDLPNIPEARYRRANNVRHCISRIRLRRFVIKAADQHVDLGHLETGDGQIEVEIRIEQVLQLDGQDLRVPSSFLCQLVVGENVGSPLCLAHVLEAYHGHGLKSQGLGCRNATVTGDDDAVLVDEDGIVKAERPDADGDLGALLITMGAGVSAIGSKARHGQRNDF